MNLCQNRLYRIVRDEAGKALNLTWSIIFISLLSIAGNSGKLYGIDGYMLEFSYWLDKHLLTEQSVEFKDVGATTELEDIVVLTISEQMYQKDFSGQSPLDRSVLSKMIKTLSDKNPDVLYFDIDMSPTQGVETEEDKKLIGTIKALPKEQALSFPISSIGNQSKTHRELKADWIINRCAQPNVSIVRPTLLESDGNIMRYYDNLDTLGVSDESGTVPTFCNTFSKEVYSNIEGSELLSSYIKHSPAELERSKINFQDRGLLSFINLNTITDLNALPNIEGKRIFVGMQGFKAQNGVSDAYLTPIGMLPGVAIHAFQHLSESKPVSQISGLFEVIIDLIIVFTTLSVIHSNSNAKSLILVCVFGFVLVLLFSVNMKMGLWVPPFVILVSLAVDSVSQVCEKNKYLKKETPTYKYIFPILATGFFLANIQSSFEDTLSKVFAICIFIAFGGIVYLYLSYCRNKQSI